MALIGKIRSNMWFVVILLGLALAAFVMMDLFANNNRTSVADRDQLGVVNGTDISSRDFFQMEQVLYGNDNQTDRFQAKEWLWDFAVNKAIINQEADEIGLGVGTDELMELQFGANLSPIIQQTFMNPQTRQVDREQLNNFRQAIQNGQLNADQKRFWAIQEDQVITNRLQTKLATLVNKGMYTPTWLAEEQLNKARVSYDFAYAKAAFAEIDDSEVEVTEGDLRTYLNENEAKFSSEEERRIAAYATIDVYPTAQDTQQILTRLKTLKTEFSEVENDTTFVEYNYGTITSTFLTKDDLPEALSDTLFGVEAGSIVGPVKVGRAYEVVKVLETATVPDSAYGRHIFRQINPQDPNALATQTALLDSLKELLESGTYDFDSLAIANGQDQTARDGGDLGTITPKKYPIAMENNAFYSMEIGEYKVFQSQAGLHLMQITERFSNSNTQGVSIARIAENIVPSEETQNAIYERALTVASENRTVQDLENFVGKEGNWSFRVSSPLERTSFRLDDIESTDAGRNVVQYLFQNDVNKGDVSPEVFVVEDPQLFYNKKLIVAGLESIIPAGTPKLEDVQEVIRPEVLKMKKANVLAERMQSKSLQSVADEFYSTIDTATNVSVNSSFVPGLGAEPKVMAALRGAERGQKLGPIKGNNGVYLLEIVKTMQRPAASNLASIKRQTSQKYGRAAYSELMTALQENADIEDNRFKFF